MPNNLPPTPQQQSPNIENSGAIAYTTQSEVNSPPHGLNPALVRQARWGNWDSQSVQSVAGSTPLSINQVDWGGALEAYQSVRNSNEIRDWTPKEIKQNKYKSSNITITKDTMTALTELSNKIIVDSLNKLENFYNIRLDVLTRRDYTSFYNILMDEDSDSERVLTNNYLYLKASFDKLISGDTLYRDRDSYYLRTLEDHALNKYHIDYSKYRYYPRLKTKIKYGNPELLENILIITRLKEGKVICK